MANWSGLQTEIANFNWDTIIESEGADAMVEQFSKVIETAKKHIQINRATFDARLYARITSSVLEAVQKNMKFSAPTISQQRCAMYWLDSTQHTIRDYARSLRDCQDRRNSGGKSTGSF